MSEIKRLCGGRLTLPLAALLIFACANPVCGQASVPVEWRGAIEQIDRLAAAEWGGNSLGGLTIGIVSGPNLIWTKSYGYADMEAKTPASKETVYRVGSITTQFTALMLLQLVEEGKVHLSDPVEKHFPPVNNIKGRFSNAPPITLVQLATHTSGIASEPQDLATYMKGSVSDWEKVLTTALPQTSFVYEPGTRAGYSNIGYAILGAALGRAAQQPYVDYMQKRILTPLDMTHSFFEPDANNMQNIAKGYALEEGKVDSQTPAREHQGRGYKVPNGALYTTVGDLARFVSFEMGEGSSSVLRKETLQDNFKQLAVLANEPESFLASGYGIGFRFRVQGDRIINGFAGGVSGYEARADFDRSARTGVIVLRNVGGKSVHVTTTKLVGQAFDIIAAARRNSSK